MFLSCKFYIFLFSLICVGSSLWGQLLTRPIPEPIGDSGLRVRLELFAKIPASDSRNSVKARINHVKASPDGSGRLFVNDLRGQWWEISGGEPFLVMNLRDIFPYFRDSPGLGTGFTSFAFHPLFAYNGLFYTTHTEEPNSNADWKMLLPKSPRLHGVLIEWHWNGNSAVFSGTRREVVRFELLDTIHGVQEISFNPRAIPGEADFGLLYIGIGDASSMLNGYPTNTGSKGTYLGTLLRIDPLGNNSVTGSYGVPQDNPFVGDMEAMPEVFAYGFRNPHRFSWDMLDGKMFCGDIGESNIEELNVIRKGGHYGWPVREGFWNFDYRVPEFVQPLTTDPRSDPYEYPAAQYDHDEGVAITSGFVYRGSRNPELYGYHLFGEIREGRIFAAHADSLEINANAPFGEVFLQVGSRIQPFNYLIQTNRSDMRFGLGADGELFIFTKSDGRIFSLIPSDTSVLGASNRALKETWLGLVDDRFYPHVWHRNLGWVYMSETDEGLWIYHLKTGWVFGHPEYYPYFFRADTGRWLYLLPALVPGWAYDYGESNWVSFSLDG